MHAVVRTYSGKGAKELFDILEKNRTEVEKLIRPETAAAFGGKADIDHPLLIAISIL